MVAIAFPRIVPTLIGETLVRTVNGRDLHGFLRVGRDFVTWMKGRITKYGFALGIDFTIVENLSSPDLGSAKARAQTRTDYFLTIDMAKELSMVENNEQGRLARRYFIDCERRAKEAEAMAYAPRQDVPPPDVHPEVRIADSRMQMVAECRRIFGAPAARSLWRDLGLPEVGEPVLPARPGRPRAKTDLAAKAERLIRDAPNHCLSRADLYRRMDHDVRFAVLDRIMNELVASGRVVIVEAPRGARIGRPPIIYRWVGVGHSDPGPGDHPYYH